MSIGIIGGVGFVNDLVSDPLAVWGICAFLKIFALFRFVGVDNIDLSQAEVSVLVGSY